MPSLCLLSKYNKTRNDTITSYLDMIHDVMIVNEQMGNWDIRIQDM